MIVLPPIGMGCAGLGNLYRRVDSEVAEETVAAALELGITYFDVAPHYGFGLGEERLGAALAVHDPLQRAIVSTKVGRLLVPTDSKAVERHGFVAAPQLEPLFDYSYDAMLRSYEQSTIRLRRDRVDLLLAHDLGEATHGADHAHHLATFLEGGYKAMRALRDGGLVGAIGLGVNELAICDTLLDHIELDFILLAGRYTLLEQDQALPLLDRCARAGTRLIIGGPYNSGILVDGSSCATTHFNYGAPPADVIAEVVALEKLCETYGVPLAAAALQFPLRNRHVASVIPGMVGRGQVEATLRFAHAPIPEAFWEACHAHISAGQPV